MAGLCNWCGQLPRNPVHFGMDGTDIRYRNCLWNCRYCRAPTHCMQSLWLGGDRGSINIPYCSKCVDRLSHEARAIQSHFEIKNRNYPDRLRLQSYL